MSNFGNPAWTVLVGDLVPSRLRAQYFGNRNLMIMLAGLVVAPLAGWLIKAGNGWLEPAASRVPGGVHPGVRHRSRRHRLLHPRAGAASRPPGATRRRRHARPLARGGRQPGLRGADRERLRLEPRASGRRPVLQRLPGPAPRRRGRHRGRPRRGQHPRSAGERPLRSRDGPPGPAQDAGAHRTPDPDHPHRLDLGHRALADRDPRGLCRARLGRLQPGQLRAPAGAHARSHRPQAVALYQTVVFASAVAGPLLGGWLADTFGFHVIFARERRGGSSASCSSCGLRCGPSWAPAAGGRRRPRRAPCRTHSAPDQRPHLHARRRRHASSTRWSCARARRLRRPPGRREPPARRARRSTSAGARSCRGSSTPTATSCTSPASA